MSTDPSAIASDRESWLLRDRLCDRFEAAWRKGNRPNIEEYLAEYHALDRAELLSDLLQIEIEYRRRLAEQPRPEEYRVRFSDLIDCEADFFPGDPSTQTQDASGRRPDNRDQDEPTERVATEEPGPRFGWSIGSLRYQSPGKLGELAAARTERFAEVDERQPTPLSSASSSFSRPSREVDEESGEARRAVPQVRLPYVPGYKMLGELGRGGMGVVYLARNVRLNRLCALKMISAAEFADPEVTARFLAEATTVARLRHRHIVQIHHIGDLDGRPYFELEYVEGGSLAQQLDGTPWAPAEASRLIETLAAAMQEAHLLGIIHRDLKPGNVLISEAGEPKITDFGLAKLLGVGSDLTRTELILGTPSYMAPEQAWGRAREVGPRADVHALGAILYELLTGRPPFKGANVLETIEQVKTIEPVAPSRLLPGLPRDLETICLTCLQKEEHRRYENAGALADDLGRYRTGEPIHARRSGRAEQAWKWCRRNPTKAMLTAVSVFLLLSVTLGPAFSSLLWLHERDKARLAKQDADDQRRETLAAQARSLRRSGQPGRRFESLAILAKAALIRPGPDLRDEAIACMALVDLWAYREWPIRLPSFSRLAADRPFERYSVSDEQGGLAIRSLKDDHLLQSLPGFGKRCQAMQFSPDGRFLAASYDDHEFYLWDLAQGEALPWITGDITGWDFSPDGQALAIGRGDSSVTMHRLSDGQTQGRIGLEDVPVCLAFSPDGKSLAVGHGSVVKVLDSGTGRSLSKLSHQAGVQCVRWGGRGRLLSTMSSGRRICTWEISGWKQAWSYEPLEVEGMTARGQGPRNELAFSPDGELIASDGLEGIRLNDAWSGRLLLTIPGSLSGSQGSEAFSPDGKSLLGMSEDRSHAVLWKLGRGAEFRQVVAYAGEGSGLAFSVDFRPGDHLLAVGERRGSRLVDPATGADLARLQTGTTEAVRFDPNGRGFVTAGLDGLAYWPVQFHDDDKGRHHVVGPPQTIHPRSTTSFASRVAWEPGGRLLAWSDRPRGEVVIEDVEAKTRKRVFSGIPNVRGVAVSPDGRWLATCPWQGKAIEIRDHESGQVVWSQKGDYGRALFSPDRRLLVTSMDNTVAFHESGSWRLLNEVSCPGAGTMAFNSDGSLLAVNSADGLVKLLDPATGETVARLQNPDPRIDPFHMAFSSDGSLLAMANGRRGVQVWDLKQMRRTLREHGLDWEWPQPPGDDVPRLIGAMEPHDPKHEATLVEHTGDWARAIPMRTALIADPVRHNYCLRRGHCLAQLGRWAEALADFEATARELGNTSLHGHVGFLGGPEATGNAWRPVPGQWYHVAHTFDDNSGVETVYVDGSILAAHRTDRPPGYDPHPLIVGAIMEMGRPMACFQGAAANFRMWRVSLEQSQIQDDVRGTRSESETKSADLVGRWSVDGAPSRILIDTSGHHLDGRIVGNVSTVRIDRTTVPAGFPECRYALRFDGPEGYIEIPDAPSVRPRSFTVEGWFNFARDDRGCWLFTRRVGDAFSISLALGYDALEGAGELEARVAQALTLLEMDQNDGYRRLCARLLERYKEAQNPTFAMKVATICSMGPNALDDFGPCIALAERAVAAKGGHESLSTLGAILCRAGRFPDAVRQLQQAVSSHGDGGSPQDQLFLAMSYHAIGDDMRAREELKKSVPSIAGIIELEAEKRGGVRWPDDWLTPTALNRLRSEAESLLIDTTFPVDPFDH